MTETYADQITQWFDEIIKNAVLLVQLQAFVPQDDIALREGAVSYGPADFGIITDIVASKFSSRAEGAAAQMTSAGAPFLPGEAVIRCLVPHLGPFSSNASDFERIESDVGTLTLTLPDNETTVAHLKRINGCIVKDLLAEQFEGAFIEIVRRAESAGTSIGEVLHVLLRRHDIAPQTLLALVVLANR